MTSFKQAFAVPQPGSLDVRLCLRLNRAQQRPALVRLFLLASRLGDGLAWCALMLGLLVAGGTGELETVGQMLAAGLAGLAAYRWIKARTGRDRPFVHHAEVLRGGEPPDRYSFPSGHTLHAVAFTTIAVSHHPGLAWLLVPFAVLVALSRVVLGLHYPYRRGRGSGPRRGPGGPEPDAVLTVAEE